MSITFSKADSYTIFCARHAVGSYSEVLAQNIENDGFIYDTSTKRLFVGKYPVSGDNRIPVSSANELYTFASDLYAMWGATSASDIQFVLEADFNQSLMTDVTPDSAATSLGTIYLNGHTMTYCDVRGFDIVGPGKLYNCKMGNSTLKGCTVELDLVSTGVVDSLKNIDEITFDSCVFVTNKIFSTSTQYYITLLGSEVLFKNSKITIDEAQGYALDYEFSLSNSHLLIIGTGSSTTDLDLSLISKDKTSFITHIYSNKLVESCYYGTVTRSLS